MASTTKVPLGAATLNRKWYLDVNTGTDEEPVWTGVFGIEDFKASKDPNLEEDSDFDSEGWKSSTVSALGWGIELKLARKTDASVATIYDVGQEALRTASDGMGIANVQQVRWYEMTDGGPAVEAYMGWVVVSWQPDGGSMEALDTVTVTLTGQGEREAIDHPDAAAAVPVLYSITPATGVQAGGTMHKVVGNGFFAAGVDDVTDIDFGVTAAATWVTESDHVLYVIAPAKAAGPFNVTVTNGTGVSISTCTYTAV